MLKNLLYKYLFFGAIVCYSVSGPAPTTYTLFTCLYPENNVERQKEYLECLEKNLQHPLISTIHIVYETTNHDTHDTFLQAILGTATKLSLLTKLEMTSISHRQTYGDIFTLANHYYPNQTIILANADIYFNSTLQLLDTVDMDNKIITLTRWEPDKYGRLSPLKHKINGSPIWGSQDVWIFTTPIKRFSGWEIPIGLQMCDHKIAFQLLQVGFEVVNPCLDVQSIHVHTSNIRHWFHDKTRSLAYSAFIPWCKVADIQKSPQDHWVMS